MKAPRRPPAHVPMSNDRIDILTPQGYLSRVMDDPNLDVVMNLFRIPRAFAVSGFGDWSVAQHSFCVAFLALYWSRHRGYDEAKRNRLMVMALTHDLHESATGDILPVLKSEALRERLDEIQQRFVAALGVTFDEALVPELKLLDRVAFLYEIRRAAVLNAEQHERLGDFFRTQYEELQRYAAEQGFEEVGSFVRELGVLPPEPDGG